MLYLAEVKKQRQAFRGTETKLRLLAYQRKDQSWAAEAGESEVAVDELTEFENGALVMVNLGGNRQIQGTPEAAGNQIVGLLEKFSRQLKKGKEQEEEIEMWKQSLTMQSQDLSQREMDIETREAQIEEMDEELERLEQQRQEINGSREEIEKLREEFDAKSKELEGAWDHLRGEQSRLEDLQKDVAGATGLDPQQAAQMEKLVDDIASGFIPLESWQEHFTLAQNATNHQRTLLEGYWQQLEEQKAIAQKQQGELDEQQGGLAISKEQLQELQTAVETAKQALLNQQSTLSIKQGLAEQLQVRIQSQENLHQKLVALAAGGSSDDGEMAVDLKALEDMPLGELQEIVDNLQSELKKTLSFVNDQEEELTLERQDLDDLKTKFEAASEYDRLTMEGELAEAQDRYQMLDETLVGQRRTLQQKEGVFKQHQRILNQRQGIANDSGEQTINLQPVLAQLEEEQQQHQETLGNLNTEIEELTQDIEQAQNLLEQQTQRYEAKFGELEDLQGICQQVEVSVSRLWGKVNLYEESLQPLQDNLDQIRQNLDGIAPILEQFQGSEGQQQQAITQIKETLASFQ